MESWTLTDGAAPVAADTVTEVLRSRITAGKLDAWLESASGRSLAVVSNTERAMVMLLEHPGDPGGHAADPGADGWSDGFELSNGQSDEYPDADTVPLGEAFRIVRHVLATGRPPADAAWVVDR
ncbi:hypothetical protein [Streptomyces sp. ML-6]|uniref:hypothetical protein n=1 Tax=Streptomyces sp. ML-6 TaxID=2982693 RepID=UPI0024C079B0|nr:hypothetical protein [Streptomyces sp. ML-6]MDK0521237.1 hypothetical protein [Streptomyces sp. ML-6]